MSVFRLEIHDAAQVQRFDDVASFTGEDASGSFGLCAGHERFMTVLRFGLARWRRAQGEWHYLAMPGGLLCFDGDVLWIGTRRVLIDDDHTRISRLLDEQLAAEERALRDTSQSLRRMEEALLRQLWKIDREAV